MSPVAATAVTNQEGYLFDPPEAQEAFRLAARHAQEAGRTVALTLSDPFCVDRHRDAFLALVEGHVDILFANEAELCSLYRTDSFEAALGAVRGHCQVAAVTRGARGSVVVAGDDVHVVGADAIPQVVDTTGAGDLYAAGFLYGLTQGRDLPTCALLGGVAAGEVISHVGARPAEPLRDRVRARLGDGVLAA